MAEFPDIPRFAETFRPVPLTRLGPPTMSGMQQAVSSPAGYWSARVSFHLIEDEHFNTFQGFIAGLDGPATPFLIRPISWRGRPWKSPMFLGGQLLTPAVAAQNRAANPAFDMDPDTTPTLDFRLAADAALNATTLQLQRINGGIIQVGQKLSLGTELHIIVGMDAADTGIGNPPAVTIRPWLRAAYPAGTAVEFAAPACLMRLKDADQGAVEYNANTPITDVTLELVEYFGAA